MMKTCLRCQQESFSLLLLANVTAHCSLRCKLTFSASRACALRFRSVKLTESINTLDGGYITNLMAQEFVMHTYSGKVGTQW